MKVALVCLFVFVCVFRAMSMVQVLLVNVDFPASFVNQLQHFLQILPLPPDLRKFKNG